jgi:hypothetical protein
MLIVYSFVILILDIDYKIFSFELLINELNVLFENLVQVFILFFN